jgi:hypothetical protein
MTRYQRHVPTGTNDRWALAKEFGFGSDSSVYDECLILGEVPGRCALLDWAIYHPGW